MPLRHISIFISILSFANVLCCPFLQHISRDLPHPLSAFLPTPHTLYVPTLPPLLPPSAPPARSGFALPRPSPTPLARSFPLVAALLRLARMEESSFVDLHQAAVAGAEGTAWTIPEFPTCSPLPPYYSTFPSGPPFESFTTTPDLEPPSPVSIPTPVKDEPTDLHFHPVPSSPPQPSLCSVSSEESFVHTTTRISKNSPLSPLCNNNLKSNIPSSPVSNISKQRTSTRTSALCKKRSVPRSTVSDSRFSSHDLTDLKGTTAARSRKMTEEERRVMLHKRRLRNRASAARSREKRSRTLMDLTSEVEDLIKKTTALAQEAKKATENARKLNAQNVLLKKENELLKAEFKI